MGDVRWEVWDVHVTVKGGLCGRHWQRGMECLAEQDRRGVSHGDPVVIYIDGRC